MSKSTSTSNAIVSVIIVNWNGKKWLRKCLDSLLSQTYKQLEIIVVDNASTDDSVQFMTKYYANRISIIKSVENLGFAGGNNLGISRASGDLIMLFNNDAWAKPDLVDGLVNYLQQHPEFGVVSPFEAKYQLGTEKEQYRKIDLLGHPYNLSKPTEPFFLSGVCVLCHKSTYTQSLGLDDNFFMYFEEIDWFWRLRLMNIKISSVPGQYIYHYGAGSTGGGLKVNSFLWRNQNTLQMLLKNYRAFNLLWAIPLYLLQNIVESLAFALALRPRIAATYPQGWWFNIVHLPRILRQRQKVQRLRTMPDRYVVSCMYHGSAKLSHLLHYVRNR